MSPTLGWVSYTLKGPKKFCVICFRRCRSGVVHHNAANRKAEKELTFRIMCHKCYHAIMGTETPAELRQIIEEVDARVDVSQPRLYETEET